MNFCAALRQLVADKVITPKAIALATGRSASTVYRWLDEDSAAEPGGADINRLLTHLPDHKARDFLAVALLTGTAYRAVRAPDNLDTNHDGTTDLYDVAEDLHNAIDLWEKKSRGLTNIRREGVISDEMQTHMQQLGNQLIAEIERAMATITELFEQQPRRRKAKSE